MTKNTPGSMLKVVTFEVYFTFNEGRLIPVCK